MNEPGTRLENHPDRHPEDYKPWLDKKAATDRAVELMEKGCVLCGAKSSECIAEYASGVKKLVQHWCAVLMETGEERLLCYRCQQTHFPPADPSR